jgi:hypothetical protein
MSSKKLKALLPDLKKFRFATHEELLDRCGVLPGAMSPFGKNIFSSIAKLFVDQRIIRSKTIGFNAASLEKSLIVESGDYLRVSGCDEIVDFVEEG